MIPKIIHYCWLSSEPIPQTFQNFIEGWKKKLPDYQFFLWNFERFDINTSIWVKESFYHKKYAFAADYIRLYALYHYGGIYLDMDVEVLKTFNPFLNLKSFICYEKDGNGKLEMAAWGVEKGSDWVKEALSYYENRSFVKQNGELDTKVIPEIIRDLLKQKYQLITVSSINQAQDIFQQCNMPIFTSDFFSPKSYRNNKIYITPNTICIHHFSGSWQTKQQKIYKLIERYLGSNIAKKISSIYHKWKK